MIRGKAFVVLMVLTAWLGSCKKDNPNPQPSGNKNIILKDIHLDGQPISFNYVNTSLTPEVVLKFSEPLDRTSATDDITLKGAPGVPTLNYSFSDGDSVVTVKPAASLKNWQPYTLFVSSKLTSTTGKQPSADQKISIVTQVDPSDKFERISDDELLDMVQQKTFGYFYDLAEPSSGMARERNTSGNLVTTGGSGFGLMVLIVGMDRGFISHSNGVVRFNKIVSFLETADRFHGAWPHWINGTNGTVIPFSPNDDGADLVETSFLAQGLLTVREYLKLTPTDTVGNNLINRIDLLWKGIEWDWFRQNNQNVLYWHWSPDKDWIINLPIHGYDEALIVYVLAAASPTHTIPVEVYQQGWALNGAIKNGKTFYGHVLPLGPDKGGPLFFAHYSFLGFDPHTTDTYLQTDYWTQNVSHTLINHDYCVANPNHFTDYADNCWGLTASDGPDGYDAQSPTNDNGTIAPTAAISSIPYAPAESFTAMKFFYYTLGDRMWGTYGFYDAFNIDRGWSADSYLAIDQGPIVIMIENYRTGKLWNLFMAAPEIQSAKTKLGLQ